MFTWQFAHAPDFFEAFGWRCRSSEELEADDLLGSLATVEQQAGGKTLLLTGSSE